MKTKKKRSALEILAANTPNFLNLKGCAKMAGINYLLLHKAVKNLDRDILHPDEVTRLEGCMKEWTKKLIND